VKSDAEILGQGEDCSKMVEHRGSPLRIKMRLASIDIGTNSVKLLVADVEDQRIANVLRERPVITRLGQGVDRTHELLPEAMDRTLKVIEDFKREAERLGAQKVVAVATSAVRDAQNRDTFVREVMSRTGLKPVIISGDEEARLTFMGTCTDPELRSRRLILVDVGGGSSEFIVGQNREIEDRFSVNTGCVRLTEEFIHADPIAPVELQQAVEHATSLLLSHLERVSMDERSMVGVGGTITSLAAIHQKMETYDPDRVHRYVLQQHELTGMLKWLSRMRLDDRKKVQGLPPQRADVIVAGVAIFSAIMKILDAKEITVSNRGIRYGVLALF
jgi:exopolyphosphatase/guanosine-5'-triphosphate,3'-diphosphate pyrophosphatase